MAVSVLEDQRWEQETSTVDEASRGLLAYICSSRINNRQHHSAVFACFSALLHNARSATVQLPPTLVQVLDWRRDLKGKPNMDFSTEWLRCA